MLLAVCIQYYYVYVNIICFAHGSQPFLAMLIVLLLVIQPSVILVLQTSGSRSSCEVMHSNRHSQKGETL